MSDPPFVPSKEWQEVPEGLVMPNGGQIRSSFATGKKEIRWENPPPPESVKPDPSYQIVPELYKLLGQAVLIPIPLRQKGPVQTGWQKLTFADTQTPDYQKELRYAAGHGNIGVKFGPDSGRLFAFDVDSDDLQATWIKRVSWLGKTLTTRGKRGCQFWLRLEDNCDYPEQGIVNLKDQDVRIGELRFGGGAKGAQSVIFGVHPEGQRYRIINRAEPLTICQVDLDELGYRPGGQPTEEPKQPREATAQEEASLDCRIFAYLDCCEPSVAGNHGDNTLYEVALKLVLGWDLSPDQALPFLRYYNQRKCQPPWDEGRLRYKLAEADKRPGPRGNLRHSSAPESVPKEEANSKPAVNDDEGLLARLERDYHGPTLPGSNGSPAKLNERFWAALFAHEHQTIYEPAENQIYVYVPENGLFVPQSLEALREWIARRMYEVAAQRSAAVKKYKHIRRFVTMNALAGVVEALKGLTEQKDAFRRGPKSPIYVHAANCMLVWNEGEFHQQKFSPDYRSRNQSPIPYDPKAQSPFFREAFLTRLPAYDEATIKKYFGQCLMGRNLTQTILLLDGVADSSKTTLARVISALIGQDNCTELRTAHLDERFEASAFIGKTLLMAPDVRANFLSIHGATILKKLVGTDLMSAEFKRSNRRVPFEGIYNVIITSNSRLRAKLEGDADAWRRRLLIVRLEKPRTGERIVDFHVVIIEREGPGILNFAIEGAAQLLAEVKQKGAIQMSPEQKARVNKFIDESDSLRNFVRDHLCGTSNSAYNVTTNEVLDRYYAHCVANDLNSLSAKDARRDLEQIMQELFGRTQANSLKRDDKSQRGYLKIKWREYDDNDQ
jgi:P4 family phage/plasmid primase-like protien